MSWLEHDDGGFCQAVDVPTKRVIASAEYGTAQVTRHTPPVVDNSTPPEHKASSTLPRCWFESVWRKWGIIVKAKSFEQRPDSQTDSSEYLTPRLGPPS